jgi:hypothetical protein
LGDPTDPSNPFKEEPLPLGNKPRDFNTTNNRDYKPPNSDDYPARERGLKKDPYHGPFPRDGTTYKDDYQQPEGDEPLSRARPRDTPLLVGPSPDYLSQTHDSHGPKKVFCCPCSVR